MDKYIENLKELINDSLHHTNQILFKRKCKITFTDVFYYLTQLIKDDSTSSIKVSSDMEVDKLCTATASAFVKKRKLIPSIFISMLSSDLLDYHYKINNKLLNNKYRVLAVDGTHTPLSKNLTNDGYKLTKNGTYVNSCINGIYDVYNDTIVDLQLDSCNSETKIYDKQLHNLQENDIIIHDRGYYSHKLLYNLYSINVYPIFRLKKSMNIVKDLLSTNANDKIYIINNKYTNHTNIKFRLIKYVIDNETYVLGTTLLGNIFTINLLKQLYNIRWNIEIYFRHIKYDLSFKNMHSKIEELIKQEIYSHMYITQLTRILEEIYIINNKHIENKMKTNSTNFSNNLNKTIKHIIKLLLYHNKVRTIIRIILIMFNYLVPIREGRTYIRHRIIPIGKWYQYGEQIT